MGNILIAEDDEIIRITVKDRLEKHNWNVDSVLNGREAVECLKKQKYRLIISDIHMPLLDGWGVLAYVREQPSDTPLLMMTSCGTGDATRRLTSERVDYILKPFDMDELVSKIHAILEQKGKDAGYMVQDDENAGDQS